MEKETKKQLHYGFWYLSTGIAASNISILFLFFFVDVLSIATIPLTIFEYNFLVCIFLICTLNLFFIFYTIFNKVLEHVGVIKNIEEW